MPRATAAFAWLTTNLIIAVPGMVVALLAYELTGDDEYLADAVFWAKTGVARSAIAMDPPVRIRGRFSIFMLIIQHIIIMRYTITFSDDHARAPSAFRSRVH